MEIGRQPLDPAKTGPAAAALEYALRNRIIGQDEAVGQITSIYQTYIAGLVNPLRPIANLLFLGPTGCGKTRLVEATAESLVGDARAVLKIDCGEFQHSHEIAKLIGSPPGYLGHRQTEPMLTQAALNHYQTERVKISFVLFDEIEKANEALWGLLLGVLDKATLTLGDNQKVDFSRAMIFMTSNLGAGEMASVLAPKLGFAPSPHRSEEVDGKISRAATDAARRRFTPEFINRLDKLVVFHPLGEAQLRRILDLELRLMQRRLLASAQSRAFLFSLDSAAKEHILREGSDSKYGARHLRRAIDRCLMHALSNLIATEQVRKGDLVRVGFEGQAGDSAGGRLCFRKEAEGLSLFAMEQWLHEETSRQTLGKIA